MLKNQKAFTLIELLVTLTVLGVVVGLAAPSFNSQILNNKSIALGEDFASALNLVRSEAVKRANKVSICSSIDGTTCSGGARDWAKGFIVAVDYSTDNKDNPVLTDPTHPVSTILHVWEKQDIRSEITVERDATATSFIRYGALGTLARVGSEKKIIINAEMHNCKGDAKRTITIGPAGLVSVASSACTVY